MKYNYSNLWVIRWGMKFLQMEYMSRVWCGEKSDQGNSSSDFWQQILKYIQVGNTWNQQIFRYMALRFQTRRHELTLKRTESTFQSILVIRNLLKSISFVWGLPIFHRKYVLWKNYWRKSLSLRNSIKKNNLHT